ncbi:MAG: zinc ribbon domain-containing protein [Solobacterium sp.]|nr:zinc ribbon domain-containing protein [Solobacterium sp.]
MAVYCTQCGKEQREDSAFCRFCGAKVRRLKREVKRGVRFFTFAYMRDAASQAAALNRDGEWSYWDSPKIFDTNEAKLRKYCEREDRYLDGDVYGPVYYVSGHGAIGQRFAESDAGPAFFEWVFYTHADNERNLPKDIEELKALLGE